MELLNSERQFKLYKEFFKLYRRIPATVGKEIEESMQTNMDIVAYLLNIPAYNREYGHILSSIADELFEHAIVPSEWYHGEVMLEITSLYFQTA